jgi:D-alanyl-D-alanine carboxypeptidase
LFFASGYRSVERQTNNYENRIQGYVNDGYTEEEARELTEEYIAVPGYSEHHTGLALDIVDQEWIAQGNSLSPDYDTQESQQWLVETMADYGFILRYPEGKEEITGINYESWHFRYVGVENAQFMVEHELVLEEYMELLHEREAMTNEESLEDESEGNNYDIEDVETPDEEE